MLIDSNITINLGGRLIDFSEPRIMAIVNVTSDSFYASSRNETAMQIEHTVRCAIAQNADILDVGAVSTRPGSTACDVETEVATLLNTLAIIRRIDENIAISIDTYRAEVVEQIYEKFGAIIVNDISGGTMDERMFEVIAKLGLPYILGHIKGTPQTMSTLATYDDIMSELTTYFVERVGLARDLGVKDILIDPCFGFAKTVEHNFTLLRHYDILGLFGVPIVASLSRKSMIYKTLGVQAEDALVGTVALNWEALNRGARLLRVHDVAAASDVVKLWNVYNEVQ